MEVIGISFRSRANDADVNRAGANDTPMENEEENRSRSRPMVCKANRECFQAYSPQSRNPFLLPTATAPKRGMIRLTALRGELENPRMFFTGSSCINSASSTGRLDRLRRTALRTRSPERRVCGVSYTPESLQSFGRQVTMTELHRTVDNLIVDSSKRHDDGWNLPHIKQLDREITRIIDATDRHLLHQRGHND